MYVAVQTILYMSTPTGLSLQRLYESSITTAERHAYRANRYIMWCVQKTGRQPDFKRKHDGSALWINDGKTPAWVLDNLQLLPGAIPYTKQRTSGRRYDFMPAQPTGDKEADWCDLFNDYQQWWDNRAYVSFLARLDTCSLQRLSAR